MTTAPARPPATALHEESAGGRLRYRGATPRSGTRPWPINHKRVYRLYRNDGLSLRLKRPRRHVSAVNRERSTAASAPNALWSMDFVSDALFDGRRLRALTVVDVYTREALVIEVGSGIKSEQVVEEMSRITTVRGAPKSIRVDNGRSWPGPTQSEAWWGGQRRAEFVSKALDRWAYENGVALDFSRPGKPTDNAFIESFNGRLRDECLNTHWFLSLADARAKIKAWRRHYNESRPSHVAWLDDAGRNTLLRWPERPPNERRILTLRLEEKSGDPQNHTGRLAHRSHKHLARAAVTPLSDLRVSILNHALTKAELPPGLFTMTVPTGADRNSLSGRASRAPPPHRLHPNRHENCCRFHINLPKLQLLPRCGPCNQQDVS